ncbi:hypothetical protein BGZ98_006834 [Dissophora globulifera]|nr:hypothetical protein BGZ98_006834 [Dissophora globulifera]
MLGSVARLVAVSALAFLASVSAQDNCGGIITNKTMNAFDVQYQSNFTVVTMFGLNDNVNTTEKYIIYCGATAPEIQALQSLGIDPNTKKFKVPVQAVAVDGTYASSYIELANHINAIKLIDSPQNVVSPCLQQNFANGSLAALNDFNLTQYDAVDAGFRQYIHVAQAKDIWIPTSVDVDPLLRIEYIAAVSLFFNDGNTGDLMYSKIKEAYTTLKADMAQIPAANKKRIGWVYYDFSTSVWRIRNSQFTRGIITDAGGIPFPLTGEVLDNASLSAEEIKTLLLNSQIVIDQTNFASAPQPGGITIEKWRELAGFTTSDQLPVLTAKKVFTLDNTVNGVGTSDYNYRMPSRPDLLLKDVIYAQYPLFNPTYRYTFLNPNFVFGQGPGIQLTAASCNVVPYNTQDIPSVFAQVGFTGDGTTPPAPTGAGIYGSGGSTGGSSGGGKKTGVIIAVVVVAVVLAAGFAFAFFKWGRRAKEDRFVELEEEMNNDIPLR